MWYTGIYAQTTGEVIQDTADFINNFFCDVGEDLFSKLNLPPEALNTIDEDYVGILPPPPSFTEEAVAELFNGIDVCKSSGIQDINSHSANDAFVQSVRETRLFPSRLGKS